MSLVLQSPQTLAQDKVFALPSGASVKVQADGNVVTSRGADAVWGLPTLSSPANPPYTLELQTDGNLVLYDASRSPKWATNTNNASTASPFALLLTDNAALELVDGEGRLLWRNMFFEGQEPFVSVVLRTQTCPLVLGQPPLVQEPVTGDKNLALCRYNLRALQTEKSLQSLIGLLPTDVDPNIIKANEKGAADATAAFCLVGLNSTRTQCKNFCASSPALCSGLVQSFCTKGTNMQQAPCAVVCSVTPKPAWCSGEASSPPTTPPQEVSSKTEPVPVPSGTSKWSPTTIAALVLGLLVALGVLYAVFQRSKDKA